MSRTVERLTLPQAQRIALAAQGFAEPRPSGKIDRRHLRRALDRMGLIQIDSVNVLVRSQELTLFARLGPHPRTLIPTATADGELVEAWVHQASHIPAEHLHLHRWHMERAAEHAWQSIREMARTRPDFVESVYAQVAAGPVVAGDLSQRVGKKRPWWDWDDTKTALEYLFRVGRLVAYRRPNDFARVYDLPERVIAAHIIDRPALPEREARKELLVLAARHHGVGTVDDLADYHRQKLGPCRPLVSELVDEGRLVAAQVDGWVKPAVLHPEARRPRRIEGCAVLSPFDPVVWYRERSERLFGFHYRIEIYTPAPKRVFGYFVLPVLVDGELVGRVDLKSDRAAGTLRVNGAFTEPGVPEEVMAGPLADELRSMAAWLGLERVTVGGRGNATGAVAAAVGDSAR